jgi:predicted nuclease of predicted toxin-antitoxin system
VQIKVDEDLPRAVADVVRAAGHDVSTVPEQGWTGWDDARIWEVMRSSGKILLTGDKGLADLRRLKSGKTDVGVVLFRLDPESWQGYRRLAGKLVASVDLADLLGAVAVVTETGIRIRRR